MADSTRYMCWSVYEHEFLPRFGKLKLAEINHGDVRALADVILERDAPAIAVHAPEVVLQIYHRAKRCVLPQTVRPAVSAIGAGVDVHLLPPSLRLRARW